MRCFVFVEMESALWGLNVAFNGRVLNI
jgi:hypothetical protein